VEQAMSVLTELRNYLRATSNTTGITDAFAFQVCSIVQRALNARFARDVGNSSITLDANTNIFSIRTKIPTATNLLNIYISPDNLHRVPSWREFEYYDRDWLSTTGTKHLAWTQIGMDLFAVYPIVTTNVTASVFYAVQTTAIDDATDTLQLATEDEDLFYTLAATILHLHLRNYKEAKDSLARIQEMIPTEFPGAVPPKEYRHD
jgi:hypothetical protein